MSENKTGKYLRYALGEIILVMIGILLALQVNNWNDNRKKKNAEAEYYCKLLEDFTLDKKQIVQIQKSIDLSIKNTNETLLALDKGENDRHYILNKYVAAIRRDIYIPLNKTFDELIFSGNLNIISDLELKNALIEYNSSLESLQTIIQKNRDSFVRTIFNFTNSSVDFGVHEFDFVNELMPQEVIETLPKDNWTKNKDSDLYKNCQKTLMYNMATAGREKDVLNKIIKNMEHPITLLEEKCEKNGI